VPYFFRCCLIRGSAAFIYSCPLSHPHVLPVLLASASAGRPGTKRDLDGNEVPQKRSRAAAAAAGGGGDAMDVSLPSPSLSAPARPGERVWHSDEHTVFVKGMGFVVKEDDLRTLFEGLAVKAVRMGLDRETGQARVSASCLQGEVTECGFVRHGAAVGCCWILGAAHGPSAHHTQLLHPCPTDLLRCCVC
jgi:hypothetical protein